jgi:hypothetical protein
MQRPSGEMCLIHPQIVILAVASDWVRSRFVVLHDISAACDLVLPWCAVLSLANTEGLGSRYG